VRILLVSHPPLLAQLGAAQVAVNLAEALRARGHAALAWSPEPLPPSARRSHRWRDQALAIEKFVAEQGPFDVVDTPSISIGPRLASGAKVIARSVQPEILYFADDLKAQLRRFTPHLPFIALHHLQASREVIRGWNRAALILCQGTLEHQWMEQRFPHLSSRLREYVVAPSVAEQEAFSTVRRNRAAGGAEGPASVTAAKGAGRRFIWIGRWAAHKGIRTLVRFLQERASAFPGDTFTVAGCGAAAARDLPSELMTNGTVRIVASFERGELPGLLARHDAGLFTSVVEGWGLCLNEMLESGLTVYATAAGGVPDLMPFWGSRLLPFPPPPAEADRGRSEPDLAGYFSRFSWPAIAQRYEAAIAG
jgi:glycosyltransferase involved in cell wall biosynthesis